MLASTSRAAAWPMKPPAAGVARPSLDRPRPLICECAAVRAERSCVLFTSLTGTVAMAAVANLNGPRCWIGGDFRVRWCVVVGRGDGGESFGACLCMYRACLKLEVLSTGASALLAHRAGQGTWCSQVTRPFPTLDLRSQHVAVAVCKALLLAFAHRRLVFFIRSSTTLLRTAILHLPPLPWLAASVTPLARTRCGRHTASDKVSAYSVCSSVLEITAKSTTEFRSPSLFEPYLSTDYPRSRFTKSFPGSIPLSPSFEAPCSHRPQPLPGQPPESHNTTMRSVRLRNSRAFVASHDDQVSTAHSTSLSEPRFHQRL